MPNGGWQMGVEPTESKGYHRTPLIRVMVGVSFVLVLRAIERVITIVFVVLQVGLELVIGVAETA